MWYEWDRIESQGRKWKHCHKEEESEEDQGKLYG